MAPERRVTNGTVTVNSIEVANYDNGIVVGAGGVFTVNGSVLFGAGSSGLFVDGGTFISDTTLYDTAGIGAADGETVTIQGDVLGELTGGKKNPSQKVGLPDRGKFVCGGRKLRASQPPLGTPVRLGLGGRLRPARSGPSGSEPNEVRRRDGRTFAVRYTTAQPANAQLRAIKSIIATSPTLRAWGEIP